MRASLEEILQKEKIMVIDGSMSTALEVLGANLSNTLWTASVLRDQPELVRQVRYDYLKAGADCGITCSYQGTIPGLLKAGCSKEEAEELITRSVTLFKEARDQWWNEEGKDSGRPYPLCLAGIGPYGAYAFSYMTAGANAAGGCCTTTCTHIEQVTEARKRYLLSGNPKRSR